MLSSKHYAMNQLVVDDAEALLYRSVDERTRRPVLVKILRGDYPSLRSIARLTQEHELLEGLAIEGVIRAEALDKQGGTLALILEDFAGAPLSERIADRSLSRDDALEIALRLVEILGQLHARGVIHKNIQPRNVLYDPESKRVVLINFFLASQLSRETPVLDNPNHIEGNLAYVSPEQTGRMNRAVDARTDFYSLGVVIYELLTGQLPFDFEDPLETVHCHIAREPVSPQQLVAGLEQPIAGVVMKLLAKNAEDRYQSARGIAFDLEQCLAIVRGQRDADDFPLATADRVDRLELPQKLYGRDAELATLLEAFARVSTGDVEMILVAGYSGIGKSSLVREVHKPITEKAGYFISGKFDQYKRNIPYDSIIQAFEELIRQLLADDPKQIERWRDQILDALGANAQVIIAMIPQLELIVGPQLPILELDPIATQNRLDIALEQFIGVFADESHPLVVFLDDLQWADNASLRLILRLLSNPDGHHLLLIGSYRDNEVDEGHPLTLALDELAARDAPISTIELTPLSELDVARFVADALCSTTAQVDPLADLLHSRSGGNPFFLGQLLEFLSSDGSLRFDHDAGAWAWDLEQIKSSAIGDNVVDLMVAKIAQLPEPTQELLQLAACVGNRFSLAVLSTISQRNTQAVAGALWEAMREELIVAMSGDYKVPMVLAPELLTGDAAEESLAQAYKFLHDRVHQAAYALIPPEDRPRVHLRIGRLLLARAEQTGPEAVDASVFEIVNNLDIAAELIDDADERRRLAQLNASAGRKARSSAAYGSARSYFTQGLALLSDESWADDHGLVLDLFVDAIEIEYLNNDIERAEALSRVALAHTKDVLERARVEKLRIKFHISQNQLHEAVEVALAILLQLGVDVRAKADDPNVNAAEFRAELASQGKRITDLPALPDITDERILTAIEILTIVNAPAFLAQPSLWPKVCFTMAQLCVTHGNSFASGFIYVYIGNILCGMLDETEEGYAIGKLAQDLPERHYAKPLRVQASIPYNLAIRHWKEPLAQTIPPYYQGIQDALAIGDLAFAGFHSTDYTSIPLLAGDLPLDELLARFDKYISMSRKLGQDWPVEYMLVWQQLVLNLMGESDDRLRLVGRAFDEDASVEAYEAQPSPTILFTYYLAKCWLAYLFRDYAGVLRHGEAGLRHELGHQGFATVPTFYLYYGLGLLALAGEREDEAEQLLARADAVIQKFAGWEEHGPDNYRHKHQLLLAEREALVGDPLRAMDHYDQAVAGARAQGFLHEEGLAFERAGQLFLRLGRQRVAHFYLGSALECFRRWGGLAKVADLEARHPALTGTSAAGPANPSTSSRLDLSAVLSTSQALAGEIILDRLLDKIMRTVLATAGAQRGFLLIERGDGWEITISGHVDDDRIEIREGDNVNASRSGAQLSQAIVNYVARTQSYVVLADAAHEGRYTRDPYVVAHQPSSVLCIPLLDRGKLSAILYLENNLSTNVFSADRVELLEILSGQAAISIENARLYETLEDYSHNLEAKVSERTQKLEEKNQELAVALGTLRATQARIVAQEKLASLGALTAGIGHEIRNPLNFVNNFARLVTAVEGELREIVEPLLDDAAPGLRTGAVGLLDDLGRGIRAIREHGGRVETILDKMQMLSTHDHGRAQLVDLNALVRDVVRLAAHGNQDQEPPSIDIATQLDSGLELIEAVPGALNRALFNIIGNAIYAAQTHDRDGVEARVSVTTKTAGPDVEITIEDNGAGIPAGILDNIFTPFFTTKPTNVGTGLGLSISHDIIVQLHGGTIDVSSDPGVSTRFSIRLPLRLAAPSGELTHASRVTAPS